MFLKRIRKATLIWPDVVSDSFVPPSIPQPPFPIPRREKTLPRSRLHNIIAIQARALLFRIPLTLILLLALPFGKKISSPFFDPSVFLDLQRSYQSLRIPPGTFAIRLSFFLMFSPLITILLNAIHGNATSEVVMSTHWSYCLPDVKERVVRKNLDLGAVEKGKIGDRMITLGTASAHLCIKNTLYLYLYSVNISLWGARGSALNGT